MRAALLLFCLSIKTIITIAQEDVKVNVYKTYADYKNDNATQLYAVAKLNSTSYHDDPTYKVAFYNPTNNKKDKAGSSYWGYIHEKRLYINQNIIQNKNFVPVIYANKSYLYFRGTLSLLDEHNVDMLIAGQEGQERAMAKREGNILIPIPGAKKMAATGSYRGQPIAYNYLIEKKTGRVFVVSIPVMQQILEHKPKLNYLYMKKGHPMDPLSIMKFLEAAEQE